MLKTIYRAAHDLTNVLAAVALLLPLLAPNSAAGRFLHRPSVRTAITGYIIMVGTIYYLLLRNLSQRQGWSMFFEYMLHCDAAAVRARLALVLPKREVGPPNGGVTAPVR